MQSAVRSLQVLEAISDQQPVGVGDLARALDLPKTSVQRCLTTLAEAGWIKPAETELTRWVLTHRTLALGRRISPGIDIREAARAPMHALRDATSEAVQLVVPQAPGRALLIDRLDCGHPIRTFAALGSASPLHATSAGKAMLASLPTLDIEDYLATSLQRITPQTITDPDTLRAELRRIREEGYSINRGENAPDVCAVGAAIANRDGRPVAAVSLSVPSLRFDEAKVPEWAEKLRATAQEISRSHLDHP
ncbi:IclR family transcriptional regulator [Rhodococcus globerulus]|uniref:IclR family transcriptional regulator n=1 Tax=Rhodococcus globerulus TaxID=33008 RepID=UPI000AC20EE1|nr:IclR family transcriptional regulator [Rhodococcus globerulus]